MMKSLTNMTMNLMMSHNEFFFVSFLSPLLSSQLLCFCFSNEARAPKRTAFKASRCFRARHQIVMATDLDMFGAMEWMVDNDWGVFVTRKPMHVAL